VSSVSSRSKTAAASSSPFEAVDGPVDDRVRYRVGKLNRGELVGQIGFVGAGERLDQFLKIVALLCGERRRYRRAERLPNTDPIAIKIIGKGAERARSAAEQPAENDATPDVEQAPPPALDRTELRAALRRQQPDGYLLCQEILEDAVCEGELVLAIWRLAGRCVLQRLGRIRLFELLLEDRLIRRQQSFEGELEIFVVEFTRIEDTVLNRVGHFSPPAASTAQNRLSKTRLIALNGTP
jgi:hypothetical protein